MACLPSVPASYQPGRLSQSREDPRSHHGFWLPILEAILLVSLCRREMTICRTGRGGALVRWSPWREMKWPLGAKGSLGAPGRTCQQGGQSRNLYKRLLKSGPWRAPQGGPARMPLWPRPALARGWLTLPQRDVGCSAAPRKRAFPGVVIPVPLVGFNAEDPCFQPLSSGCFEAAPHKL